jgi:hypothetical protein
VNLPGYCSCSAPARAVVEGLLTCDDCGEPIADPLLVRILAELVVQRRQLANLERKLTEPKQPTPDWLAPKEFARLLGRSVDFVQPEEGEGLATRSRSCARAHARSALRNHVPAPPPHPVVRRSPLRTHVALCFLRSRSRFPLYRK